LWERIVVAYTSLPLVSFALGAVAESVTVYLLLLKARFGCGGIVDDGSWLLE
jgi:hypothetical protein